MVSLIKGDSLIKCFVLSVTSLSLSKLGSTNLMLSSNLDEVSFIIETGVFILFPLEKSISKKCRECVGPVLFFPPLNKSEEINEHNIAIQQWEKWGSILNCVGTLFLLRRAGLLAPDATLEQASEGDRDQARAISKADQLCMRKDF